MSKGIILLWPYYNTDMNGMGLNYNQRLKSNMHRFDFSLRQIIFIIALFPTFCICNVRFTIWLNDSTFQSKLANNWSIIGVIGLNYCNISNRFAFPTLPHLYMLIFYKLIEGTTFTKGKNLS